MKSKETDYSDLLLFIVSNNAVAILYLEPRVQ